MDQISAGLLMYRKRNDILEVFLAHPGGPFWKNKDEGAWSIPKGLQHDNEELLETAKREFSEETGIVIARNPFDKLRTTRQSSFFDLGFITYKSGKKVYAWAFEDGTFDPKKLISNTFQMEWPPHSGKIQEFPESDRGDYFSPEEAQRKIIPAQKDFLTRLQSILNHS